MNHLLTGVQINGAVSGLILKAFLAVRQLWCGGRYQFEELVEHANQWRHWRDICDDGECWAGSGGVSKIIEYWAADPLTICKLKGYDPAPMCESGKAQDLVNYRRRFLNAARPGAYNDPGEMTINRTVTNSLHNCKVSTTAARNN